MSASTGTTSSASVYTTPAFWERLWRTAGIQSVLCFIVAYIVYGHQPQVGASADALEIDKSINSTRDTPMNQRIRPCQLGVAFCDRPKSSKQLQGIFLLVRGKAFLEIGPASHRLSS